MKYFTRAWADGELNQPEYDLAEARYRERLQSISARLPAAMRHLATTPLHDAVVERIEWSPQLQVLRANFVAMTDEDHYVSAELVYRGAMLGVRRVESLRRASLDREAEILYDEVDMDEGGTLIHRLLFWPREEVTIDFLELELVLTPRVDRRVNLQPAFLVLDTEDRPGSTSP